ncbi:FAD/FMN-containing dehydrogenase [Peteryoungia aggregata LMG 23059]|uniref:FAD/FMN-containing dehydrogenase n=1 Tax=Peteryoungia aggregata LMG 23059 TaxID=1368425 RepID=A0ABU0GBP1_9HYPH|nr:FAD/FMN-containing dehydrogenase [Peteryoungia aggregata LMG 23059]
MSTVEFMLPMAFTLVREAMSDLAVPLGGPYPAYGLMEISGSCPVDIEDLMHGFLDGVMEDGLELDGVIATSEAQAMNLWLFRDGMNAGRTRRGPHLRTDVSVPPVPALA